VCVFLTKWDLHKDELHENKLLRGLVLGMTLTAFVLLGKNISGGCYNPAIGLAQSVWMYSLSHVPFYTSFVWIYVLVPICSGIIAGVYHRFLHSAVLQEKMERQGEYSIMKKRTQSRMEGFE